MSTWTGARKKGITVLLGGLSPKEFGKRNGVHIECPGWYGVLMAYPQPTDCCSVSWLSVHRGQVCSLSEKCPLIGKVFLRWLVSHSILWIHNGTMFFWNWYTRLLEFGYRKKVQDNVRTFLWCVKCRFTLVRARITIKVIFRLLRSRCP